MHTIKKSIFLFTLVLMTITGNAQNDTLHLTLDRVIKIAQDSSLKSFCLKNQYLISYWQYKNKRNQFLPILALTASPIAYDQSVSRTLNPVDTTYISIEGKNITSDLGLNLSQIIPYTGGQFSVSSSLNRFQDFKSTENPLNYSSSPAYLSFSQPIFTYNQYKWDLKIAPLEFEKARKTFLQKQEELASATRRLFAQFLISKKKLEIAKTSLANADTLFLIGQKRFEIASIEKTELLSLEYTLLNSKTIVKKAENEFFINKKKLLAQLRMSETTPIELEIPDKIPNLFIDYNTALQMAYENNPEYVRMVVDELQTQSSLDEASKKKVFSSSSVSVSYGLNKSANNVPELYVDPSKRQNIQVSFAMPLIDWGARQRQYKIAQRRQETTRYTNEQQKIELEQNLMTLINDFNIQSEAISNAKMAQNRANEAYEIGKRRFIEGGMTVNNLNMLLSQSVNSTIDYITQINLYWDFYYQIRSMSMYNFEANMSIIKQFEEIDGFKSIEE